MSDAVETRQGMPPLRPETVEPWLRNTHTELDALRRQVIHALELTGEDALRWAVPLTSEELHARPFGLPSVGFQLVHMARSLDRLLTYASGSALSEAQQAALATEHQGLPADQVFLDFHAALRDAAERVLAADPGCFEQTRWVGRDRLSTTLGGLLIHCAEHTQRHSGQMITTAKVLLAQRSAAGGGSGSGEM